MKDKIGQDVIRMVITFRLDGKAVIASPPSTPTFRYAYYLDLSA